MRFLCIFGIPRTGSSHLNKLLRSCPQIDAKSEIFHRHAKMRFSQAEIAALEARAGVAFETPRVFADWRRAHPAATLEALHGARSRPVVAFKVFPFHLKKTLIESEFFSRDDMGFAVLTRRPIESFISGLKARSADKFATVDTTAIKPELTTERFSEWATRMKPWYEWVDKTLAKHRIPCARLSFEEHLDGLSGEESLARVLPLLKPLGFDGIDVPKRIHEGSRQDKETRYQDRVANWDDFVSAVKRDPQVSGYFDWALQVP
jgi:hypothetical protein